MLEIVGAIAFSAFILLAAVILIPLIVLALLYNSLVSKRNQVDNAFASVDVQLKKRYDLIPNLVSAVKGYMKHEKEVLTKVTELRAKAISGKVSDDEKIDVNNQITAALKTIFATVENYPNLKANENFLHLQASLTEVEEQISAARRAYNASVLEYNNAVEMLPTSLIASMLNFRRRMFFEASEGEKDNPGVK